jgi:hypothetical protein
MSERRGRHPLEALIHLVIWWREMREMILWAWPFIGPFVTMSLFSLSAHTFAWRVSVPIGWAMFWTSMTSGALPLFLIRGLGFGHRVLVVTLYFTLLAPCLFVYTFYFQGVVFGDWL